MAAAHLRKTPTAQNEMVQLQRAPSLARLNLVNRSPSRSSQLVSNAPFSFSVSFQLLLWLFPWSFRCFSALRKMGRHQIAGRLKQTNGASDQGTLLNL